MLWGRTGELWSPAGRLPDFSYAGYRGGLEPIPHVPVKANVKEFGATGDGVTDDTAAFLKAVGAVRDGAILIPKGRYKITRQLLIRKSGVVFRGEGEEETILRFPRSLTEAVGPGKGNAPGGSWSWSGGFFMFDGRDLGEKLADVSAPARRGDVRLVLSGAQVPAPGQWVRLVLTDDDDGSLARHLHADQSDGAKSYVGPRLVDFASPVATVRGSTITLARFLRVDVRMNWKPAIYAFKPAVSEVGVERLTIEFPAKKYAGHHEEPGHNAINLEGVANAWIRHVRIVNADNGVFLRGGTRFATVEFLRFAASPERLRAGYGRDSGEPRTTVVGGHHALVFQGAHDCLVSDFQIDYRFIHDAAFAAYASGNVFSRGRGADLAFDHHRLAPYENMLTEIDAGDGARLWQAGGDLTSGPPSGARETVWNLRSRNPVGFPKTDRAVPEWWAVQGNFIGFVSEYPSQLSRDVTWWEPLDPLKLTPPNLYEAQKARRAVPRGSGGSGSLRPAP